MTSIQVWVNRRKKTSLGKSSEEYIFKRRKRGFDQDHILIKVSAETYSLVLTFPGSFKKLSKVSWVSTKAIGKNVVKVVLSDLNFPQRLNTFKVSLVAGNSSSPGKPHDLFKTKLVPRLTKELRMLFRDSEKPSVQKYIKVASKEAFLNLMILGEYEWYKALLEKSPPPWQDLEYLEMILLEKLEKSDRLKSFLDFFPERKKEMEKEEKAQLAFEKENKRWIDFLTKYNQDPSEENIELFKQICDWAEYGDLEECSKQFYYKVRNEGTSYFFESYTDAFDDWDLKTRNKALKLNAAIFSKLEGGGVHSLVESPGTCKKCGKKLSLDEEVSLAVQRYGMGPGIGPVIRGELAEAIVSGKYTCEKCLKW